YTVDGFGSLRTPYLTSDVLRAKPIVRETDSIRRENLGGFGFNIPRPVVIEYKWLGHLQDIPLLQINTTAGIVAQVIYRDSLRINPLAVDPSEHKNVEFSVYPNPFTEKVFLTYHLDKTFDISFEIFNA